MVVSRAEESTMFDWDRNGILTVYGLSRFS